MPENFRTKRQRFRDALDQADNALTEAVGLLDDLPAAVTNHTEARQLLDEHQTPREKLRAIQRRLEKL